METEVINHRATLFVSTPINIDEHTLPKFVEAFNGLGLLPSVNKGLGLKFTPQGVVQENVISLDMKYLDDTLKVSIGSNRFDIVCTNKAETIDTFLEKVKSIIIAISKAYLDPFTKLALCSTIFFNIDVSLLDKVYGKVVNIQDEFPVEWQIRKVLRSKVEDKNKTLTINNVYTLSRNIMQIGTEVPIDRILLDMDINTIIGTPPDALEQLQTKFWNEASTTIENTVQNYKKLILHE